MKRFAPLVIAVAAFFAAAVTWIGNDRTAGERTFDEFSVENTSESGLSLVFRYLQRSGHRVVRLDEPPRSKLVAPNGVVIRAGSFLSPSFVEEQEETKTKTKSKKKAAPKAKFKRYSPLLTTAEDEWVRNGGRLVLATSTNFGPIQVQGIKRGERAVKVFPLWPGVESLVLPEPRAMRLASLPPHMHELFIAAGQPVIARDAIGAGEVIVMSIPEVLQNQHLRANNGLLLATALAGTNRPVYFDESVHGFASDDGSMSIMKEWGLGPFLLFVAAAGLLFFWRNASRVGPAEDDYRETRSDAVDLVRSLGALYKSATTDDEAIGMYREALVRSVAAQTGLRGEALNRRVAELLSTQSSTSKKTFQRDLDAINNAFRALAGGHHAIHR